MCDSQLAPRAQHTVPALCLSREIPVTRPEPFVGSDCHWFPTSDVAYQSIGRTVVHRKPSLGVSSAIAMCCASCSSVNADEESAILQARAARSNSIAYSDRRHACRCDSGSGTGFHLSLGTSHQAGLGHNHSMVLSRHCTNRMACAHPCVTMTTTRVFWAFAKRGVHEINPESELTLYLERPGVEACHLQGTVYRQGKEARTGGGQLRFKTTVQN